MTEERWRIYETWENSKDNLGREVDVSGEIYFDWVLGGRYLVKIEYITSLRESTIVIIYGNGLFKLKSNYSQRGLYEYMVPKDEEESIISFQKRYYSIERKEGRIYGTRIAKLEEVKVNLFGECYRNYLRPILEAEKSLPPKIREMLEDLVKE